jgi:two-component system, chemotaxis family, protein-glutamate methylesterase/glutaminase
MMAKKKFIKESSKKDTGSYSAVVIGTSAGGMAALQILFKQVDKKFALPIIVVQHLYPESNDFLAQNLNLICPLHVKEASEKETIRPGEVFISPANYHLLVEDDYTFSLNIDPKVNYCRPSIDVLFESAAQAYSNQLIGVLLTGANNDGAKGLKRIKEMGGITIVQDPQTAEIPAMPLSAINLFPVDFILPLQQIYPKIKTLTKSN